MVPSIYEPFGLVALESMASGCPASWPTQVASARSFPRTAPGFASARLDPEALAEVAIRVLRDEALGERLVAEGLEHIRGFDWADVAGSTAGLYDELAGVGRHLR